MCSCHRLRDFFLSSPPCFLRDVKTAVNTSPLTRWSTKTVDGNTQPVHSPVLVHLHVYTTHIHIFKEIIKLIILTCVFHTFLSPRITASTFHVTLALTQEGSPTTITWHDFWLRVVQ